MEDPVQYGNRPIQSFTVYKFEVDPDNPDISRVQSWKNLSSEDEYKNIIPSNYRPCCHKAIVKGRDFYLVVHLKTWEGNSCCYYIQKVDFQLGALLTLSWQQEQSRCKSLICEFKFTLINFGTDNGIVRPAEGN